jgi:putative DNA primase/helicase
VRVLEADPALRGLVWFDEFLQRLITGDPAREWSDVDDINLVLYMQREIGLSKMGIDSVRQAVVAMAKRHARNCVKEYIEATRWDGTPRIESFMHTVFHCEDTEYTRAASRNFWISMLARVYQPGCKVDNMIVLEGTQGLMKSSALNAIADPWFAEQHEAATNAKAFAEVLQASS